jgi:hypothetical protein
MVMGYFDESGGGTDNDFLCMSGYLANNSNFDALTDGWNEMLRKHRLHSLHLADFVAMEGPYSDLHWDGSKINEVLVDFISVVRRHTIAGIGVGVDAKTFRSLAKANRKRISPQVFCFERILHLTMKRLEVWRWDQPVCMIFDDSEAYSMACYHSYCEVRRLHPEAKNRLAGIAFGNDEAFAPLQAADLLAYAVTVEQRRGEAAWSGPDRIFRDLLLDIDPAFGKMYDSERWTKEALEEQGPDISRVVNRERLVS